MIEGNPLTGILWAVTTGTGRGGFSFPAAGASGSGIQGTRVGEFEAFYPYIYSYTYATLRNDAGVFGPGQGPGSFSLPYKVSANTVAKVVVKQGAAKFGGTMRMLGQLTSKFCYYRNGGCSISSLNWRYDAIGAAAYTRDGVVTRGYIAYNTPRYCTLLSGEYCYGGTVEGSRFPWTTGSVTVTAKGRGPHATVHYAKGYDNRTPTSGSGKIQLVSPTLTRWLQPAAHFETGGIGIFRLTFQPCCDPNDGDGIGDALDNCSDDVNSAQDDTDQDSCGNLCDADYDQTGVVGFSDFLEFANAFGTTDEEKCHQEPIPGCTVSFPDFLYFAGAFNLPPGPSGPTAGTTACP